MPCSSFLSANSLIASVLVPASVPVLVLVDGSERCWMIVLLTANLYRGLSVEASEGVLSEIRDCRILLMMVLFQLAVASCV